MRVVVVGAGLSGLFTASELVAAGIDDVVVVDRGLAPGGVARTVEIDRLSLEPAAGSFSLPHPHLSPILGRAGVDLVEAVAASTRYVFISGRLVEIPASPKAVFSPLLPVTAKLRALAEPMVPSVNPGEDESLESFCRRRFGESAGGLASWLMASGVYAGDPGELSASSAFPALKSLEGSAGSVIRGALRARRRRSKAVIRPRPHVPVGGMSAMSEALARSLGDRYRPGFDVANTRPAAGGWVVEGPDEIVADAIVLAIHPRHAAELVDRELSSHLRRAVSVPVVTIGLGGMGESPLPPGFGALVAPDNAMVSRGLLFESSYAPDRAPDGAWLLKVIAGGAIFPELSEWDDDRLIAVVTAESERVLGSALAPQFTRVVRHRPGIPQYVVGHGSWLADMENLLVARPGLRVTGWGYRGVGVAHQATDAVRTAQAICG